MVARQSDLALGRRDFLRMALAGTCLWNAVEFDAILAEEIKAGVTEPTLDEVLTAIERMNATSAFNVTSERLEAAATLQRSVDRLRAAEFNEYFQSAPDVATKWENERGILRYLNVSFDKAVQEMRETVVPDGSVAIWHVYNMGVLVKTPTQTFAVDIKHRRALELVPDVEFLLVTHNHGDHFTKAFCDAMTAAGKPVVSNFIKNDWYRPEDDAEVQFGDCHVILKRVDHNKSTLINYVTTFEINCGSRAGDCVIYHVGDACDVAQLRPTAPVDVFIPHLAVGLDVPKCVNETIRPKLTLLSHILELGHLIDKWRWSYEYGYDVVKKCANDAVVLPVWGEKFFYARS